MKHDRIPDDHHVIRVVPFTKYSTDESGISMPLYSAFQLKPDEEGLSVTWREYFPGDAEAQLKAVVWALRASNYKPGAKAAFAIGNVGAIRQVCSNHTHSIRVVHWPEDDNKAHSELRKYPLDDAELLQELATSVWSTLVLNSAVPAGEAAAPAAPADRSSS